MDDASLPHGERGNALLLEHCAVLDLPGDARPPAFVRLEHELGGELARLLVGALAARRGRQRQRLAA
jgi:hypothetical protein